MAGIKRRLLADDDARQRAIALGDLAESGLDVFCWCNRCGHNSALPAATLLLQLGPAVPVPEVGMSLRCTSCSSKDVATRPAWQTPGQVTRHN